MDAVEVNRKLCSGDCYKMSAVHALSHRNEIVGPNLKDYLESSLRVNGATY